MKELNVEQVFIDRMSGKNTDRPELKKMMSFVREGDTVIVESISRFARNTKDLLDLVEQLTAKVILILFSVKFIVMGGLYMSRRVENIYNSKSTVVGVL